VLALCAALTLSTAFYSGTAIATTSTERKLHSLINSARGSHGLGGLTLSTALSKRAHRHSARMADSGRLFHSCLTCRRGTGTTASAENVGVGDTLQKVHVALMNSASHRANILSKSHKRVGVGVVSRGGRVWVTQLFG
jgi:uncharacterized protein YkwD